MARVATVTVAKVTADWPGIIISCHPKSDFEFDLESRES
jgi:hypothetical protein